MKHRLKTMRTLAATLITIGSLALGANAASLVMSYTTNDMLTVTATFNGDVIGNTVTNVSNVTILLDGNVLGAVDLQGYYGEQPYTISFLANENNFWFSEAGAWNSATESGTNGNYGFALIGSSVNTPNAQTFGNNFEYRVDTANGVAETAFPGFSPLNSSYSLTVVPEPSSALLFGFAALGFAARRRRTN